MTAPGTAHPTLPRAPTCAEGSSGIGPCNRSRNQITAITNRTEAFHGFADWLMFGGDIGHNDSDHQEKIADLLIVRNTGSCAAQVRAWLRPEFTTQIDQVEHRIAQLRAFTATLREAVHRLDALPDRLAPCDQDCHLLDPPCAPATPGPTTPAAFHRLQRAAPGHRPLRGDPPTHPPTLADLEAFDTIFQPRVPVTTGFELLCRELQRLESRSTMA